MPISIRAKCFIIHTYVLCKIMSKFVPTTEHSYIATNNVRVCVSVCTYINEFIQSKVHTFPSIVIFINVKQQQQQQTYTNIAHSCHTSVYYLFHIGIEHIYSTFSSTYDSYRIGCLLVCVRASSYKNTMYTIHTCTHTPLWTTWIVLATHKHAQCPFLLCLWGNTYISKWATTINAHRHDTKYNF